MFANINLNDNYTNLSTDTFNVSNLDEFIKKVEFDPYVELLFIDSYGQDIGLDHVYYNPLPLIGQLKNANVDQIFIIGSSSGYSKGEYISYTGPYSVIELSSGEELNTQFENTCIVVLKKEPDNPSIYLPYFHSSMSVPLGTRGEEITVNTLLGYMYSKFGARSHIYLEPNRVNIIAIRSYRDGVELKKNSPNNFFTLRYNMRSVDGKYYTPTRNYRQFSDKIYLLWKNTNGLWELKEHYLSTLHGYAENLNGRGRGIVKEGQHINSHMLHFHKGRSNHQALRQSRKILAYRDKVQTSAGNVRNGYYDLVNLGTGSSDNTSHMAGFNIHTALKKNTKNIDKVKPTDTVSGFSLGCQTLTVPNWNFWEDNFIAPLTTHNAIYKYEHEKKLRNIKNYADFSYILLEEWDIVKYLGENKINGFEFNNIDGTSGTFENFIKQYPNVSIE